MPEGDTLRHAAARLAPLLTGERLEAVWFRKVRGHRPRPGQQVVAVRAVGKHLLIDLDRELTLDTHLGMSGRWATLPRAEDPRADPRLRIVLTVAGGHALCWAAPTIRTFLRTASTTPIDHLGPDLGDDDPDLEAVLANIERIIAPTTPVAEVLLDQRVAAGVGNVYKSEALHAAGVHPRTPIGGLDRDTRLALWRRAHRMLVANREPGGRRTAAGSRTGTFVYGRDRQGCLRCDGPISSTRAGPDNGSRSTYWCGACQPLRRLD